MQAIANHVLIVDSLTHMWANDPTLPPVATVIRVLERTQKRLTPDQWCTDHMAVDRYGIGIESVVIQHDDEANEFKVTGFRMNPDSVACCALGHSRQSACVIADGDTGLFMPLSNASRRVLDTVSRILFGNITSEVNDGPDGLTNVNLIVTEALVALQVLNGQVVERPPSVPAGPGEGVGG